MCSKVLRRQLITDDEHSDLNKLFLEYDANGNGVLEIDEMEGLTKALKIKTTPEDIKIMMEEFDKDGSGTIDCGELLMLVDKVMAEMYTGDEIIEAFKSISEDEVAKGVINAKKLSSAISVAGIEVSEEEVIALCKEVDESGNGTIEFAEFRNTVLGF